jgi:FlaA1/EpsC-like NDP-sugar epimerase
LLITDAAVVAAVVLLAQCLRFGEISTEVTGKHSFLNYCSLSVIIVVIWLLALTINGSRSPRIVGNGLEESKRIVSATISVFGVLAVFSMFFQLDIARGYLAIALPLGLVALLLSRWVVRRFVGGEAAL